MYINSSRTFERILAGLPRLGFVRSPAGGFRLGDLDLRINKPWLTFWAPPASGDNGDPLHGWLGRPGLWKPGRNAAGTARRFDIPIDALIAGDDDGNGKSADPLEAAVNWAVCTAAGKLPGDWRPLLPTDLPGGSYDMLLQHDRYICRGSIRAGEGRLALRMPILRHFRRELPEARMAWLKELLADAQDRCPMVRLGLDSTDVAVDAVVDLSGCPAGLLEAFIRTGRDALRWTVKWLVSSVDLLADPDAVSELLQASPARA